MSNKQNPALQPPKPQMIDDLKQLPSVYPAQVAFMTLTGSHMYGTATDEYSDYDVRGMHLEDINAILGFDKFPRTKNFSDIHPNGKKVECVTHELEKFIHFLLRGYGSTLEDLYSPFVVKTSPLHEDFKDLGRGCITALTGRFYEGMAEGLSRRMKHNETKKFIHVYRCYLMGIHLMISGDLVYSLADLAHEYKVPQVLNLIEMKKEGVLTVGQDECRVLLNNTLMMGIQLSMATKVTRLPDGPTPETIEMMRRLLVRTRKECLLTYDYPEPNHRAPGESL